MVESGVSFVFCGSYKQLLFALYLKNLGKNVIVVAYSNDVFKYCAEHNIICKWYPFSRVTFSSFYKIFGYKKKLDRLIKELYFTKDDEFFMTCNSLTCDMFYIAKELSKKGDVYFFNAERSFDEYVSTKPFLRGKFLRVLFKTFMGLDLVFYDTQGMPRLGVDETFLVKHNIKRYGCLLSLDDLVFETAEQYAEKDNHKVLLVGESLMSNFIVYESMVKMFNELNSILCKNGLRPIAIKQHPALLKESSDVCYRLLQEIVLSDNDELSCYVPVEFFFKGKRVVLSITSLALITASRFSGVKSVSLLDLVEWKDLKAREDFRKCLSETSGGKVLFPKDFVELGVLLRNIGI